MSDRSSTLAAFALLASIVFASSVQGEPDMPRCEEDATLIGAPGASFMDGRWSKYACGPSVDDYRSAVVRAVAYRLGVLSVTIPKETER